jgi:hydroxyacylglutathione hydrolase
MKMAKLRSFGSKNEFMKISVTFYHCIDKSDIMSQINLKTVFNPLCGETTYYFSDGDEIGIVDPGNNSSELADSISKLKISSPKIKIILTHAHYDHIAGVGALCDNFNVEVIYVGKNEEKCLYPPLVKKGYSCEKYKDKVKCLVEGDKFNVGKYEFHVIDTPGHTIGGVMYVCDSEKIVFTGDSLFKGTIGATHFEGGNHDQLIASLKRAIDIIPDDFTVYPGHSESTTIGEEKKSNPFLI